jgi:two-component system sensor histidine kinase YesM
MVNIGDSDRELAPVRNIAILLAASAILLLAFIGIMLMRGISGPMSRIVGFLNAYPSTSHKERMKPGSNNEMGKIVGHFNRLMDKMDEVNRTILATQTRLYEAELEGKKAQLSALQSQIHPHFLYNTLDCVRSIALVSGLQPIVDISVSMAAIFRYSIRADGDATIQEEMDIVEHYIKIIRIRHQNRISVDVDMPGDLSCCVIPRMILQPVVENAVYHGLEPKEGDGIINVRGFIENGKILLIVDDDGIGLDAATEERIQHRLNGEGAPEEDERIRKTTGIGLINIQRRLRFRYGMEAGLSFVNKPEGGTRVCISLPMIRRGHPPAIS